MRGHEKIQTERLLLRPLRGADEAAWVVGLSDFEVAKWLAAPPFPYTPADFCSFLATAEPGSHWAIEDATGVCGGISLAPHLGYWLTPRAQGRGYATEAARAVLAAHFARPEAGALKSGYFEGNTASARVLEKLGFSEISRGPEPSRPLGRVLAHVTQGLTREAWAAANPFTLTTRRLVLDPVTGADAVAIRRIVTDPRVGRMLFVFSPTLTEAEALGVTRSWRWTGTPPFRLALRRGEEFVGAIGLKSLVDPEIYYFLAPELHGQGLMSEVLPCFIDAITARFGLARLTAKVFTDNPASAHLLAQNGFRPGPTSQITSPARSTPTPVCVFIRP
ncbi:MAG: GNAT family N-acetyltransferase [Phaeovulum sp.]|uniref:GNAT family N-acetyltransferase n=2 Tax=Phaeovulum sp. TaxID=2934796 RepID=UPI0027312795|nr:GNAT family N-acetyltransferase [Phaeovulum sp.]MDP2061851.1 GNAT family N-acetyltransferase [Phaeovulum sp.]